MSRPSKAQRVLIVVSSGPSTPARCAAPFHTATLLACMDAEVTLFLSGEATQLARSDVAEHLCAVPGVSRYATSSSRPSWPARAC